jgi:hypothetical protein
MRPTLWKLRQIEDARTRYYDPKIVTGRNSCAVSGVDRALGHG